MDVFRGFTDLGTGFDECAEFRFETQRAARERERVARIMGRKEDEERKAHRLNYKNQWQARKRADERAERGPPLAPKKEAHRTFQARSNRLLRVERMLEPLSLTRKMRRCRRGWLESCFELRATDAYLYTPSNLRSIQ